MCFRNVLFYTQSAFLLNTSCSKVTSSVQSWILHVIFSPYMMTSQMWA